MAKRELAFVCEDHYPHSQAPWRPPHACSFALCSQCIRNEVGMSTVFLASLRSYMCTYCSTISHNDDDEEEFIDSDEDYNDRVNVVWLFFLVILYYIHVHVILLHSTIAHIINYASHIHEMRVRIYFPTHHLVHHRCVLVHTTTPFSGSVHDV